MKIAALYKTFSGHEFIIPSVESIYEYVDKIFFVHSMVDWHGKKGNTVISPLNKWVKENDKYSKIVQTCGHYTDQKEQYRSGFKIISDYGGYDWVMIIDSDEVWDKEQIERAINYLKMDFGRSNAVCCKMRTYVKNIHYMIWPVEPCLPTVFVNWQYIVEGNEFIGTRGNSIPGRAILNNVFFHHYTLVRDNEDEIFKKIMTSSIGDNLPSVDMETWKKEKWDKLPHATNFHWTKGFENCWKNVVVLKDIGVPRCVKEHIGVIV